MQGLILLVFVAQALFILIFGERRVTALKPAPFATSIHLVSDPWSMEQLASFSELGDPSVFALPSLHGFSRAGWLTYKTIPEEFADEPQQPRWLELSPDALGRDLAASLSTNSVPPLRIVDESMPPIVALQPRPSSEIEFPKSRLRITGALARRKLLSPPELPSWPNNGVLTNSVVQVLVDGDGAPFSAALVSGSGSREADQFALAATKRLRFKPDRTRDSITSGTANFHWHTAPARSTNTFSPGLISP